MSKPTKSTHLATDQTTSDTARVGADLSPNLTNSVLPNVSALADTATIESVRGLFPEPSSDAPAAPDMIERMTEDEQPISGVDDPLLSLAEAGRMVNKSGQTIARWIGEGLIPFVRLPGVPVGRRAVRRSVMQKFLGATALMIPRGDVVPPAYMQRNDPNADKIKPRQLPPKQGCLNNAENNELGKPSDPARPS